MLEYRNVAVVVVALIVLGGLILAKPDFETLKQEGVQQVVDQVPTKGKSSVKIPSHAVEIAPGLFFLGTIIKDGRMIEGYAIVDYKKGFGKPSGCNYDNKCQGWEDSTCSDCLGSATPDSQCYEFISKGAKWKKAEGYLINPSNTQALDTGFVVSNFATDIEKWEDAAQRELIGSGVTTNETLSADMGSTDSRNEVYFGSIDGQNAIAITVVWGYFRGHPSQRELIEWDMVFDEEDFAWGSSEESDKMDFESIATHELGHAIGLSDLYESKCSEETMYGYAAYGEIKQRSLEAGDIKGINELYN